MNALPMALAAAILATSVATAQTSAPIVQMLDRVGIEPKLGDQVPTDTMLLDERGRQVRLGDYLAGKPVILQLVYFKCPMLCNMAMEGLLTSLELLSLDVGRDVTVLTISFDPREGPELAAAAKHTAIERYGRPGADGGWHFLTGEEAATRRVADAVGFRYAFDPQRGQYAHAAGIFVLTPTGKLSRYLGGVEYSTRDLRLAVVEASDGKVGTFVDRALLVCYLYDPVQGKYGLAVLTATRLGGAATALVLAGSILAMIIRERRKAKGSPAGDGL